MLFCCLTVGTYCRFGDVSCPGVYSVLTEPELHSIVPLFVFVIWIFAASHHFRTALESYGYSSCVHVASVASWFLV